MQEIFIDRVGAHSTVGNIYKGKVVRILPGMQSAFVEIGQARSAFIHVTDLMDGHRVLAGEQGSEHPPITGLIHEGEKLLVQVTKEPIGAKGARITTNLSMASRYLVYLPGSSHIGISQRIEEAAERERLEALLKDISNDGEGFVVRTAAENASHDEIAGDAEYLRARWRLVQEEAREASAPRLIYEDLPLPLRAMRDIINKTTARIFVDHEQTCSAVRRFLHDYIPEKLDCLAMAEPGLVLFDRYQLDDQIDAALNREVPLKSGGYLVIDQTEAMATIDVNTGAFVGRNNLEETIYRTNLEAAAAIPRQLKLRNIGGIVIIDFIDMVDEEHKRQVLRMLEKGRRADRVKCNITRISELGLVEMTRKRASGSLLKTICEPCPVCDSRGFIKSAESVCLEIFKNLQRKSTALAGRECLIMASQAVVDRLIDEQADGFRELANLLNTSISCQVEPGYTQEQYDLVVSAVEQAQAH